MSRKRVKATVGEGTLAARASCAEGGDYELHPVDGFAVTDNYMRPRRFGAAVLTGEADD